LDGNRIKLLASQTAQGCGAPGTTLDEALTIACGNGAVRLLRLQRAGRGAQDTAEFLRGVPVPKGARFT
jgi:methionyl-tRNA formyltransferase